MSRRSAIALLAAVAAVAAATCLWGVDFGHHWDEPQFVNSVVNSLQTGRWLPIAYNYPSLCYDLYALGLMPKAASLLLESAPGLREHLIDYAAGPAYLLRMRGVFILLSCASILWIYGLARAWRRSRAEALLAAGIFGLSWEFAYHARWAVADGLLAQFSILSLMAAFACLDASDDKRRAAWLRASAAAAGLACGAKYQGGLILLPAILAALEFPRAGRWRAVLEALALFGAAYLLTTPGTLLEPSKLLRDIESQRLVYKTQGHYGYTVEAWFEHGRLLLDYLARAAFSRFEAVALLFFILSLVGLAAAAKEDRRRTAIFLSFPLPYLLLMISQRVMIVRNYLVVLPFLAVLASRGVTVLGEALADRPSLRRLPASAAAAALALNTAWLAYAAASITRNAPSRNIQSLADYIAGHRDETFVVTERVARSLEVFGAAGHPNAVRTPSPGAAAAVFYSSEVRPRSLWTANRRRYTSRWFGPYEVNFDYYPTWAGAERIVVMPLAEALKLSVVHAP